MSSQVNNVLRTYSLAALQQMARQRGLDTKKQTKEKVLQALSPRMVDPDAIQASLDDLEPVERLLLDRVILAGGNTPTELIRRQLERESHVDPKSQPERGTYLSYGQQIKGSARNRGSRTFEDVVARLGALGLAFTAEPLHSTGSIVELNQPGRRLFIPDVILRRLPSVEVSTETTPVPVKTQQADPAPLLRDVYLLLSFAARGPIPLTARGLMPKRTLVQINGMLFQQEEAADVRSEEELAWLPFLRSLVEELGLLVASAGELQLDERTEAFLRRSAGERQQRLFESWRQTARWNELFLIPNLTVKGKGMSVRNAASGVIAARERLLKELVELPVGEWVTLEHLVERVRLRAYEFLLPRIWTRDHYSYYGYYGSYGGSSLPNPYRGGNELGLTFDIDSEETGWNVVEAEFIFAVIAESLHMLGVVDLGGTDERITAFRITIDGARLLNGEKLRTPPSQPQVIVQPNFQIVVMEPTGEDTLFRLDQMAERLRADRAIEYELTRDSVYRAQRAGLEADAIIAFLESVSTVGVPQNVRRTVEEWGHQHERITVRQRTPLLHALDEKMLDGLYADSGIAPLLGRRVAPTVALVPHRTLQPLFRRLVQRKLLPALSEGPDSDTGPVLSADPNGRLAFRQQLPSIFDIRSLRSFADEEDGAMQLSPQSLRRGAKGGASSDDMLATLERLHAGPLPPEVTALVRKWARNWGQGALIEAAVLQVEDPETLADLLADPELRPSLLPVPGAAALAVVRPDAVERVRTLLYDRGMVLGDQLIR